MVYTGPEDDRSVRTLPVDQRGKAVGIENLVLAADQHGVGVVELVG